MPTPHLIVSLHENQWQIEIIARQRSFFWGDTSTASYHKLLNTRKYLGVKRNTKAQVKLHSIYFQNHLVEIQDDQIIINRRKIIHRSKHIPDSALLKQNQTLLSPVELYPINQGGSFVMQIH